MMPVLLYFKKSLTLYTLYLLFKNRNSIHTNKINWIRILYVFQTLVNSVKFSCSFPFYNPFEIFKSQRFCLPVYSIEDNM